jgi:hypothetical protein
MSNQTATQTKCLTCGHIIDSSSARLSAINFRRYVNSITDLNTLIRSKDYLTRFIRSRYRVKEFADKFLNDLETKIEESKESLTSIKIWILGFINIPDSRNPSEEVELYKFLRSRYSDIDATFDEFYQNYFASTNAPMNKNRVSRALSALGLKTEMKKITRDNKPRCSIVICASQDELSEILRKNGF